MSRYCANCLFYSGDPFKSGASSNLWEFINFFVLSSFWCKSNDKNLFICLSSSTFFQTFSLLGILASRTSLTKRKKVRLKTTFSNSLPKGQSYKRNKVLNKSKVVLNLRHYFNLDHIIKVMQQRQGILSFLRLNFFIGLPPSLTIHETFS